MLGPHIVTNVEQGLQFSLDDYAWAHRRHTEIYRRFQAFFDDVDLLICPAAAVTPFPGEISYPESVEGVPARTYFHWLAINYGLTLTTSPVIALPSGVDRAGLPFGIQVVGPRGSDRFVLAAARELELALAAVPRFGGRFRTSTASGAQPASPPDPMRWRRPDQEAASSMATRRLVTGTAHASIGKHSGELVAEVRLGLPWRNAPTYTPARITAPPSRNAGEIALHRGP